MQRLKVTKLFIALGAILVLIQPMLASAAECGFLGIYCAAVDGFATITNWITYSIAVLGGWLINIAAALIQILIETNRTILDNAFVIKGFSITLNLANLGFVLAIIIIAVATILRFERYGMKAMLRNLIIAAVLINFSLAIVGVFVDFTNSLGMYFIQQGAGGTSQFSDALANALNVNKLTSNVPEASESADIGAAFSAFVNIFVSLAVIAIFTTTLVITFFAVAAMIFIRAVYLGILVILMPLAWFAWVIPDLAGHWKKWWGSFIQWTLFFPIVSMFLYLAIIANVAIGTSVGTSVGVKTPGLEGGGAEKAVAALEAKHLLSGEYIAILIQIVLQVGFVFGGLIAANKMGIAGADTALKMADTTKSWILGKAGRVAMAPAKVAGGVAGGVAATAAGAAGKAIARKLSGMLYKVPGAKGLANTLAGLGQRKAEVEEYQKSNLSNLNDEQIKSLVKSPPLGSISKAAVFAEAAKRKILTKALEGMKDEQKKNLLSSYASALKAANPGVDTDKIPEIKELANIDPKLVSGITGKTLQETVKKVDVTKLVEGLSTDYIKANADVIEAMDEVQLKTFKRMAKSKEQLDAAKGQLEKAAGANLANMNTLLRESNQKLQDAKKSGSDQEIVTAKAAHKQALQEFKLEKDRSTAQQKAAYEKLAALNQIIGEPEII